MIFFNRLQTLLPSVVMVALVIAGLGAGYYFASAATPSKASFPVTWSVRPLQIQFSASQGSGSAPDSFTCSRSVSPVTLQAQSGSPSIITATVSPFSFTSCGSTPDNIVVTVACTAAALANHTCAGNFDTEVLVCGPTPYTCLQKELAVNVDITT